MPEPSAKRPLSFVPVGCEERMPSVDDGDGADEHKAAEQEAMLGEPREATCRRTSRDSDEDGVPLPLKSLSTLPPARGSFKVKRMGSLTTNGRPARGSSTRGLFLGFVSSGAMPISDAARPCELITMTEQDTEGPPGPHPGEGVRSRHEPGVMQRRLCGRTSRGTLGLRLVRAAHAVWLGFQVLGRLGEAGRGPEARGACEALPMCVESPRHGAGASSGPLLLRRCWRHALFEASAAALR